VEEYLARLENGSISSTLYKELSKNDLYDIICELDEIIDSYLSSNQYNDVVDRLIEKMK
jgi:hypothetical protein